MPSLRLFIAIETPPDLRPQIAAIRDRLKASDADVKWEPNEKLHATIKFLGNTDDHLLPEIVSYIRGGCQKFAPFQIRYKGVGCFPNSRTPRVIWVGMDEPGGNLNLLHLEIDSGLVALGFEREEKRFHPHVTLGRVKSNKKIHSLLRMMESITFESQPVTVHEIALMQSELNASGSVYTILNSIPLGS
ncbi:MAG TPA: RNA 2',3'-cyclic phosphodiesterase [Bacteroidota bacterium]|nr:RNA 2',3'-cyclic phosphodiesterase [Bacteroidota bacterium]